MASPSSKKAFLVHLAAYAGVIAILVTLNAMTAPEPGEEKVWWSFYAAAGWGIGVLAHGLAVWLESRSRQNSLLADEDARGVGVHLFVYLAVNALLIVVNIQTSPDSMWSVWPVLGWGAGLAAHAWLAYRKILRKTVETYATEQQILSEMQLERQAAAIAAQIAPEETAQEQKQPSKRHRRTAAKKKTAKKKAPARKGRTPKRAAAKSGLASRTRKASSKSRTANEAKPARKPASRTKKPASRKAT